MDDRAAHFFTLVGSVCEAARLAELPVRLRLQDGSDLEGHPLPAPHTEERELDDTGYVDGVDIGKTRVALSDVVAMRCADDLTDCGARLPTAGQAGAPGPCCPYTTGAGAEDSQSSIDIVLRRFVEYHDLEGAFGRRAIAERAKGILMERHSVDEATAFTMLRTTPARATQLVHVAAAVVDGHGLLPRR